MRSSIANAITFRALDVFRRDHRAVAAVEFALILPLMLALYLGGVEFSNGFAMQRQVSLIASTVANLTGQATTLATSDATNILNASTAIIAPYSTSGLAVSVSCLSISSTGVVSVSWSATLNATAPTTVTVPSGLAVPGSKLIYSQVSYPYTPNLGYIITGTLTLSDHMYQAPRISAPTYNGTAC